ncbi:hypothetical protein EVG20_g11139 [Dentipellis fragilis]|uniref:Uncharacterized protein n=1 Tax=Dentipellis fragilis TaxID=205917 RepID=A0A4Y9XP48_9AGAM|nr:hypothetical protein EVG20_g11139 [Dentipellis fragilis]
MHSRHLHACSRHLACPCAAPHAPATVQDAHPSNGMTGAHALALRTTRHACSRHSTCALSACALSRRPMHCCTAPRALAMAQGSRTPCTCSRTLPTVLHMPYSLHMPPRCTAWPHTPSHSLAPHHTPPYRTARPSNGAPGMRSLTPTVLPPCMPLCGLTLPRTPLHDAARPLPTSCTLATAQNASTVQQACAALATVQDACYSNEATDVHALAPPCTSSHPVHRRIALCAVTPSRTPLRRPACPSNSARCMP